MSNISVFSRAHRALRSTSRFHFARSEPAFLDPYRHMVGDGQGEIVGIYENPVGAEPQAIVVTEGGLLTLNSGSAHWIEFSQMASVKGPGAKLDDQGILLTLQSGASIALQVAGRDGRFSDVFGFVRFLDRVLEDLRAKISPDSSL